MALKEEQVLVTSSLKKSQWSTGDHERKDRAPKNQNTLPRHLLSQSYHEIEVCRGRERKVQKEPLPKKRESDDKNAVSIVKIAPQLGCVSKDKHALVSQRGLGTLPNTFSSSKRTTKTTFQSPAEKWVLPVASTKEPEENEFVVDSGAIMHMVSKRDLSSAELKTMRTSRTLTTVMTANGEVQTREEATVFVKESDLFVTVVLLEETPAVLSRISVSIMGKPTTGPAVKNHISYKKARELIAIHQTLCHSLSLVHLRVPPQRPHLLRHHLHHRIPCLMSTDTPKIQYPKEMEVRVRSYRETCSMNRQKPKTKRKMKETKKYKAICCMTCRTGFRISESEVGRWKQSHKATKSGTGYG